MYSTTHTPIYTHPFNGSFSGTTQVSRYQKGKTNLDFTEARDSEWQWHQLGHNKRNQKLCYRIQTDRATRYVSQNLVNCRNKLYDKSATNRMELEGYS